MTIFSVFQEEVLNRLLCLDVLQESLSLCVKSLHGRTLERMKWGAKPSELRVAPLTGSVN